MLRIISRDKEYFFDHPIVMGILNVTPDSFSDGGQHNDLKEAVEHCGHMLEEGATIIDVGGCSTRPGLPIVSEKEEMERVIPIIRVLRKEYPDSLLSVDTFRKSIAERCIGEGADIINDISGGLFDGAMLPYIGERHIPYVMMHCAGGPETMHQQGLGGDIHQVVAHYFETQIGKIEGYGEQQIILDPGIGFSKTMDANYALLRDLERYRVHRYPILIGISRKSLIFKHLNITPQEADNGTTVLNTVVLLGGVDILRVHDVGRAMEAIKLVEKIK